MEITLEKIELIKDRTGVSYAEAKAALEKADGSVVDAIIMIEEEIDIAPKTKAGDQASQIVEKIKELVKKGNVSKILVKKNGETIVNLPVNVGILGIVFVPWVTLISVIAALGTKCSIELVKENGDIVNLSSKAAETFGDVKSNYSVIADDLKEKGGDAFSQVKEKASSVIGKMKREYNEFEDDDYFNFDDFDDSVFDEDKKADDSDSAEKDSSDEGIAEKAADAMKKMTDRAEDIKNSAAEKMDGMAGAAEEKTEAAAEWMKEKAESAADRAAETADAAGEKIEDAADAVKDSLDEAGEKFEETIEGYKAKKNKFRFFE